MKQAAIQRKAPETTTAPRAVASRALHPGGLAASSSSPLQGGVERLGHRITELAGSGGEPPLQLMRNRRRWTPAQREQSRKFWEKKHAREERNRVAAYVRGQREKVAAELAPISQRGVVSGPAGHQNPSAPRGGPLVPARPGAALRYRDVTQHISDFLDPAHPVRSVANDGGPQLVQNVGHVTRRVGVDVEPSGHVAQHGPHLNLQTQHGGVIQGGPLADPHHPVLTADPFSPGHPLHGLQPEEQRKFLERYLTSSGFQVRRP